MLNFNSKRAILHGVEQRLPEYKEFKEKSKNFFNYLLELNHSLLTESEKELVSLVKTDKPTRGWIKDSLILSIDLNSYMYYGNVLRFGINALDNYIKNNNITIVQPAGDIRYDLTPCLMFDYSSDPLIHLNVDIIDEETGKIRKENTLVTTFYLADSKDKEIIISMILEMIASSNRVVTKLNNLVRFLNLPDITMEYIKKNYRSLYNIYKNTQEGYGVK